MPRTSRKRLQRRKSAPRQRISRSGRQPVATPTVPSSEPCPGAYTNCPPPWPGATPQELEIFYSTCC
jgi:hypothetical protein